MRLKWRVAKVSSGYGESFFQEVKTGSFIIQRKTVSRFVDERRDVTS